MSDIDALLVARIPNNLGTSAGDLLYWTGAGTPVRLPIGSTNQVLTVAGGLPVWAGAGSTSPGTQLDYAQITTSPAAIAATTEATAVAQITGNSVTYDGTQVRVEFFCPKLISSSASIAVTLVLLCDTRVVGQVVMDASPTVGSEQTFQYAATFDTPSAGAHVYKAAMFVSSQSATVGAGAGGSGALVPAYLRVTKA